MRYGLIFIFAVRVMAQGSFFGGHGGSPSITSLTITHNLNLFNVPISCYSGSTPIIPGGSPGLISITYPDANTVKVNFDAATNVNCMIPATIGGVNPVVFSGTPNFDLRLGRLQTITLTADVTASTVSNPGIGVLYTFKICQDSSGLHTFTWPTGWLGGMTIGTTASKCNLQSWTTDDGTNFYATGLGRTNL